MLGNVVRRTHEVLISLRDAFLTQPHAVFTMDTLTELPLTPTKVREAAHVQRLAELGPREIREIAADKLLDPARLAPTARRALEAGRRLWVVDIRDGATLVRLEEAMPGALTPLGPATAEGRRAYGITPAEATRRLLSTHPEQASVFEGADATSFPHDILATLSTLSVPVRHRSAASRLIRNPRLYVYLAVFVYSALRALPVVFVKEFEGSLLVLWSIDVLTAIPYTWGVMAMVTGSRIRTRILGTITTVVTFVTPYVYFALNGRNYPPYVIVVIAAMILAGLGLEVAKYRQERALERRYAATPALRLASS
ncbi:MAG TPA: hypothetical protein PKE40_11350 [Arachnia sp.]|nr:hypothetical protein [Arachnia sp.]HMT86940.1 hypothetical protein [Arachnia sp.]